MISKKADMINVLVEWNERKIKSDDAMLYLFSLYRKDCLKLINKPKMKKRAYVFRCSDGTKHQFTLPSGERSKKCYKCNATKQVRD
jgi:hypothetical protein